MLFDPTGTKCVENKKKSFICGWFFTRNEIVNVHENRFSLLTKKTFYEPRVDSKKKAEARRERRSGAEWKTKHSLSRYFSLSEYFLCNGESMFCLSQKSTFSHRAAFLPVGLVVKEIQVFWKWWKSFEKALKAESIGNKTVWSRSLRKAMWQSLQVSKKCEVQKFTKFTKH